MAILYLPEFLLPPLSASSVVKALMSNVIHPTAIVSENAIIGAGTSVGPYSCIGPDVIIGKNNTIGPHVVLEGRTTIGDENHFFQFCSIGAAPQDLKYHGEESVLKIGDRNIVREYVTLQPGTEGGGMETAIANDNLFMANSHVGHDCFIGSHNVVANSTGISGHVSIGDHAILGGLSGIHQFSRIGSYSLLAGGAMVTQDIPPFCMAQGDRAALVGLNLVGLKRHGFGVEQVSELKKVFRQLFLGGGKLSNKVETLKAECNEGGPVHDFLDFIASSSRGIAPTRRAVESGESS